ncbi:MAG TPA: rRNA maturation RNase YbeY [Candidatus Scatomorpha pullistercoris]|uniref:Endoribonuclease YbeY n=1 Tax=Candidatus Scatomorpha pullistercoris TaxID=2840929 RepID=A0A9D1G755_9FIRM|nr:rRNA maturation RNase YbeY [Candidatus Scatomorpha pullistercoris]
MLSRTRPGLGHNEARRLIQRAITAALREENVPADCEVSVLLTDNEGIHELNRDYRGVDRPTDVLSFPANELAPGEFDAALCEEDPETGRLFLGDMAISLEKCEAQAVEYGHSFERELMYLTVHSTLHLLGYDHVDEAEMKRQMRGREDIIMSRLGV